MNDNNYDKQELYQKKIAPLLNEVELLCNSYRIPWFSTAAVRNDEMGTAYESNMVLASTHLTLKDNRIAKAVLYLNHVDTQPPEYIRRALNDIMEYYIRIYDKSKEQNEQLELTDDLINGIARIVKGGDALVFENKHEMEEIDLIEDGFSGGEDEDFFFMGD